MVILNKQTIKILRYIKRKGEPTAEAIMSKFSLDTDLGLIILCKDGYLLCTKADGSFTDFNDASKPLSSSYNCKYWATPLTDELLENKASSLLKWMVPTILAFISLVLSVITFLYTVIDKSPIQVHLLP